MIWFLSAWTLLLIGTSLGLAYWYFTISSTARATGAVAIMAATDMQNSMVMWKRCVDFYEIIQRYVYMPPLKNERPS